MKLKKILAKQSVRALLLSLHVVSFVYLVYNVVFYAKQALGVAGDVGVEVPGQTFVVTPTAQSGGTLTANTTYRFRVAAYNSGGTPIVLSPISACLTDSTNKQCLLTWQDVTGTNNYKVFWDSTSSSNLSGGTTKSYKQVNEPASPPVSLTFSDTTPDGSVAIPADSTNRFVNKFTGSGNFFTLEKGRPIGFGLQAPSSTTAVEFGGNIALNSESTMASSGAPSGNNDYVTKTYVLDTIDAQCDVTGYP